MMISILFGETNGTAGIFCILFLFVTCVKFLTNLISWKPLWFYLTEYMLVIFLHSFCSEHTWDSFCHQEAASRQG